MKGRYLLFAVCLGYLAFGGARADDADTARAAARRVGTPTATRTKNTNSDTASTRTNTGASRGTSTSSKSATNTQRTINARTAAVSESARKNAGGNSTQRTNVTTRGGQSGATVMSRPVATTARTATATMARGVVPARTTGTARVATPGRAATTTASRARAASSATTARAAAGTELRDAIIGRDYTTCRKVYYECMDEFCANKDAQLKRCACSTRLHEFDRLKKNLSDVEDKLLDFNQRLLTVNMDKEDAAAIFVETEGETAFNQKDTSASKKILDEISKKLNSDSDDSFNRGLSAISLSLNTDAAFDSVDSLMGVSTTSKEGAELYDAALPICREMAAEVCDDQALGIVESGYQMQIEQDCNTVAKTYQTQTDQAREKIREGSALLDISRLDIHQKRNSDDVLACKRKMLTQLSATSVCGENLGKCLDISGQYIDPSTGQAFLTNNLANLASLITRPSDGQTWTGAPGNDRFVNYLNSKKKYLEPAMGNCQDIADSVWDAFIEDALSQIKLAQEKKLEEVRQSCTTLTTQCLSDTAKSISEFDSRALSTFGVIADKTANEMCASVRTACTTLMESTGGNQDWIGGMTQIAADKTYETILSTCREVGRACIIQACKSVSGNFGMCESLSNSINRKSIINRTACWSEVMQCVAEAGSDTINRIFDQMKTKTGDKGNFYQEMYGFTNTNSCSQTPIDDEGNPRCIYDICQLDCESDADSYDCRICRLAEKIWGNCEDTPATSLYAQGSHNRILIPPKDYPSTLLSWFAENTDTQNQMDSCRDTTCPVGYTPMSTKGSGDVVCFPSESLMPETPCGDKNICAKDNVIDILKNGQGEATLQNCCKSGALDNAGNCCVKTKLKEYDYKTLFFFNSNDINKLPGKDINLCNPYGKEDKLTVVTIFQVKNASQIYMLGCLGELKGYDAANGYPSGRKINCSGKWVYMHVSGSDYKVREYLNPYNLNKLEEEEKEPDPMYYLNAQGASPVSEQVKNYLVGEVQQCKVVKGN